MVYAVSVFRTERDKIENYLEFGGDVIATTSLDINPEVQGKLIEVKVAVGDYVEKDEVIALVDASRPGMSYALGQIKSPISGTITQLNMMVGSMVAPQLSVAKVSKLDSLQISMNVPERYISKIKLGQTAALSFDAYPDKIYPASVQEISPVLDVTSRTMNVKLGLGANDGSVKIGMFARVRLVTEVIAEAVILPDSAVVNRFGESFVFVLEAPSEENGDALEKRRVRKQAVVRGIRVDEKAEIIEGLKEGDEVVVRGQSLLEDASFVQVVSYMDGFTQEKAGEQ
jgi:RND family efflux transporter MFP subunit